MRKTKWLNISKNWGLNDTRIIMSDEKNLMIRNSTAEFLTFELQSKQDSIEVRYEDETIWLTQRMMSELFDVAVPTINEHLKNIYSTGELDREATIRKFRIVQTEGARKVEREVDHYNLDAVIKSAKRLKYRDKNEVINV